jgi:predicted transcriptional regulator
MGMHALPRDGKDMRTLVDGAIIISIGPRHTDAIFSGKKRCEFRKVPFSRDVRWSVVYALQPVGKLVGWFMVDRIDLGCPDVIWSRMSHDAGMSREEFEAYYAARELAVCLRISHAQRFDRPVDPREKEDGFMIPQSFRYMTEGDACFLEQKLGRGQLPHI